MYEHKRNKMDAKFTFIDLFSGIGGFRIPLEKLGGRCLGFSEIDKHALEIYKTNFCALGENSDEIELGDITKLNQLPFSNIDLIVGGVPCQSWSVAGKMRGFADPRGKLWEDAIRLVKLNQPKAFIFENVKGLIDPRNSENLELIITKFKESGYSVFNPQVLNSLDFGLPQNRERLFIVGIRVDLSEKLNKPFEYPKPISADSSLSLILDSNYEPNLRANIVGACDFFTFCDTRNGLMTIHSWDLISTSEREKYICLTILRNRRKKKYGRADGNPLSFDEIKLLIPDIKKKELDNLISKKILKYKAEDYYEFVNSKNSAGINGVYRIYLPQSRSFSTLTATGTKDMISLKSIEGDSHQELKENFIKHVYKKGLYRKIKPREAAQLQGFPNWFVIHQDEHIAHKQFGNAVSTNVVLALARNLIEKLKPSFDTRP